MRDRAAQHLADIRAEVIATFDIMQAEGAAAEAGDRAARDAIARLRGMFDHIDRTDPYIAKVSPLLLGRRR
jgi:hypothetical protein